MVMLGAIGCRTSGPVAESTATKTIDSTHVTVRERMVPVNVPGVSFDTYIDIACDPVTNMPAIANRGSAGSAFPIFDPGMLPGWLSGGEPLKVPTGTVDAEMQAGRLKISFLSDSIQRLVQVQDSIIKNYRTEHTSSTAIEYVRDVRWYDRVSHWVTALVLAYGIYQAGRNINLLKRIIT